MRFTSRFFLLISVIISVSRMGIAQSADSTLGDFEYAMTISANTLTEQPFVMGLFESTYADSAMVLTWTTLAERNNARFEVERSVRTHDEGMSAWETLAFVPAGGTSDTLANYVYMDAGNMAGVTQVYYRLKQVSFNGTHRYSETIEAPLPAPHAFAVSSYPDPYAPAATIEYDLPERRRVRLTVYDESGRHIKTLVNKTAPAGRYRMVFDASDEGPGLYMYRLEMGGRSWFEPMLLVE